MGSRYSHGAAHIFRYFVRKRPPNETLWCSAFIAPQAATNSTDLTVKYPRRKNFIVFCFNQEDDPFLCVCKRKMYLSALYRDTCAIKTRYNPFCFFLKRYYITQIKAAYRA